MGQGRRKTGGEIEGEVAAGAQPVLHRRAEDPQRPHVEDEVQPAAMEEHVGREGQIVRDAGGRGHGGMEVAGRDEGEQREEPLQLWFRERRLKEEAGSAVAGAALPRTEPAPAARFGPEDGTDGSAGRRPHRQWIR